MKRYGNEKTSIVLSAKAYDVYCNSDPCVIIEEDDGTYTMRGIIDRSGMTAEQVNTVLEDLEDSEEMW